MTAHRYGRRLAFLAGHLVWAAKTASPVSCSGEQSCDGDESAAFDEDDGTPLNAAAKELVDAATGAVPPPPGGAAVAALSEAEARSLVGSPPSPRQPRRDECRRSEKYIDTRCDCSWSRCRA